MPRRGLEIGERFIASFLQGPRRFPGVAGQGAIVLQGKQAQAHEPGVGAGADELDSHPAAADGQRVFRFLLGLKSAAQQAPSRQR